MARDIRATEMALREAIHAGAAVTVTVKHMSETRASALKAVADRRYAVPAQEATRQAEQKTLQEREGTKRHYASTGVIALIVVGVLTMLGKNVWDGKSPDVGLCLLLLAVALAAIGGPEVAKLAREWMAPKSLTGE